MSDNESDDEYDSDNGSIISNEENILSTKINKLVSSVKPIQNKLITNDSDIEDDDSIIGSDNDEVARGADERDDIDEDYEVQKEDEDETNYNKNIIIDNSSSTKTLTHLDEEEDDEDDENSEIYLQKFNSQVNKNYITNFHPECLINNYEEIVVLTKIIKDSNGNIIDDLHRTLPFLTKYEKARILGQRAKQINTGSKVFIKVPEGIIDGYLIAIIELEQKKLPFIIRRPIAGGGCEYWNLKDLENIAF